MLKMYVNETELNPAGLGAQKGSLNGEDVLVVAFCTDKQIDDALAIFKALPDDTVIKIVNEKREQAYTGYVSLGDEVNIKPNVDGTYNYTVYMHKKSALDIAKQAAADVEYLAAVSGVEL